MSARRLLRNLQPSQAVGKRRTVSSEAGPSLAGPQQESSSSSLQTIEAHRQSLAHLVNTQQRAAAFDLHAHLTLTAFPVPPLSLTNELLRLCSNGSTPAPERALDLYNDILANRLEPDAATYTHLIRACARTRRSGESFYGQALDLQRQMIDAGFEPTPESLMALLEGAKRNGDLARARWIVSQLASMDALSSVSLGNLFQAYGSYPIPRVPRFASSQPQQQQEQQQESTELTLEDDDAQQTTFPGPMPRSSQAVAQQLVQLMAALLQSKGVPPADALAATNVPLPAKEQLQQDSLYARVKLDAFLINSWLLAFGHHSTFATFASVSSRLLQSTGVRPNGHTWKLRLEACEKPKDAARGAEEAVGLFKEWQAWHADRGADRETQAVWTATIRSLARAHRTDDAFDLTQAFFHAHPPSDIVRHAEAEPKPEQRPVVSVTSEMYPETQSEPRSPRPPQLVYSELHILFKRLADMQDARLDKLQRMLKGYRRASRKAKQVLRESQDKVTNKDRIA